MLFRSKTEGVVCREQGEQGSFLTGSSNKLRPLKKFYWPSQYADKARSQRITVPHYKNSIAQGRLLHYSTVLNFKQGTIANSYQ
ncbi:unnamed protein product [Cylicocyclus nassatus]|uniref:Uncharacterized protein n=1 Tax=Cylicocyclus nassatus TaxID=53992 RepID=A0AA36GVV0_CYLNA|nr:unnamed protein product [Cylicocyclus nassatus]